MTLIRSSDGLPTQAETLKLFDDFFALHQSWPAFTFLHQGSLKEAILKGSAPTPVVLVMCAIALRLRTKSDMEARRSDSWVQTVRTRAMCPDPSDGFSSIRLATVLLLRAYEEVTGNVAGAWLLTGLAARMASGMRLYTEEGVRHLESGFHESQRERCGGASCGLVSFRTAPCARAIPCSPCAIAQACS